MKILYAHRTRSSDGQYVHISELIAALRARGHDVVVAAPDGNAGRQSRSLDPAAGEGGLWRRLPSSLYEIAERAHSRISYQRITQRIKATTPDCIYERYNLHHHAGIEAARRHKLPHLLEVNAPLAEERRKYGELALRGFAEKSERRIWNATDIALPVTEVLATRLRAAGVPDEKIHVIHNGVSATFLADQDGAAIRERYGLSDVIVLGFAGFVRDWHGLERVIKLVAQAEDSRLRLLIVGDGPASEQLKSLAADLGVAERVVFTGVIQRDEMPSHIAAFDIALQPAVVEYASPLKLFEYMALARAIVAPASANIREVLCDGVDCALFGPEAGSFERTVLSMIEASDVRSRLGAAARRALEQHDLTWAGNARRIEALAEKLIRERHDNPHRD